MAKINLKQYGITGTTEVIYNPSYDELYRDSSSSFLAIRWANSVISYVER